MQMTRRGALALMALAVPMLSLTPANAAETTINVTLWDKGPNSMDGMDSMAPMGMNMDGAAMKANAATMGVDVDVASVPAGQVTFAVTNASKGTIHEMLVLPIPDAGAQLPYDPDTKRLDEEGAHDLGEVSELDPGASGKLTLTLEPGSYMLVCNIAGHYAMGMWTLIEVTG